MRVRGKVRSVGRVESRDVGSDQIGGTEAATERANRQQPQLNHCHGCSSTARPPEYFTLPLPSSEHVCELETSSVFETSNTGTSREDKC